MDDYLEYLERYCNSQGISKEKAEELAIVKEIKKYYLQRETEEKRKIR